MTTFDIALQNALFQLAENYDYPAILGASRTIDRPDMKSASKTLAPDAKQLVDDTDVFDGLAILHVHPSPIHGSAGWRYVCAVIA